MASARIFGACRGALMAAAKGAASGRSTTVKTASPKARVNVGIQKVVPVSAQLRKFLGTSEASRTDAVKKVWEYIKLHNLQEYNAKLSDFGLAKDGPEGDRTHVSTRVMGTYGYAARVHNDRTSHF